MTTTGNFAQRHARSQPPLAPAPPLQVVQSLRSKRPILQSSRLTGEVPPKGVEEESGSQSAP